MQILALEHNAIHRQALRTMLSAVRIEPFWVGDMDEAMRACRSAHWDMMLMDVGAGPEGLDPVRTLRALERREGLRRTALVAMVEAMPIARQKNEYLAAGVDALASKPIHLPALLRTLEQVLFSEAPVLSVSG
jgi:CheY-like chemotaxis protein